MTAQDGFQILARAPGRDAHELGRVGSRLGKTFAVTVKQDALQSGGVLVYEANNLEEAQSVADRVRDLGADAVIVDPEGQVIGVKEVELSFLGSEQEDPRSTPSADSADQDKTLMGGWGDKGPPAVAAGDAVDIGFAQTMVGPGQQSSAPAGPTADGPGAGDAAPSEPEQAAEPDAQAETAMMASGFALDNLDADSLVMLDGSQEEQEAPASAPAEGGPSLDLEEPVASATRDDDFAPPSEDEVLELDHDSQSHQLGVAAVDHESFTVSESAEPELASEAPAGEMDYIPAEEAEAEPAPEPPPEPDPRSSGQMTATSRAVLRTALRQKQSPLDVVSDIFRERPRLRIVIGFILALGLGSILPTCYARSVVRNDFHPLLVDLSTAKAHGDLLRGQPDYRTPEDIEAEISSMQTRHGIYSFLFWLVIGGGVGFAWFRFTRP
jgi:hypothetical protein